MHLINGLTEGISVLGGIMANGTSNATIEQSLSCIAMI